MSVDIARVQARLLEMAKQVTSILEKENIPYMITDGSLLGAVRHQGFIPWDDDFDIFLFGEDDYEKITSILKKNLPEDLFVEDEDSEKKYYHAWSRVKCKKTYKKSNIYPLENSYKNQGLSLDLFKLKKIKYSELHDFIEKEHLLYIQRIKKYNLLTDEEIQKKYKSIPQKKFISTDENSNDRLIYTGLCRRPAYEVDDILPLKKYKFEDTYFYGPNNYHNILKGTYGDYMTLPPVEKRKTHYESVIFK